MFNPKNSVVVSDIWGALGTFYNKLDSDSKIIVEKYWEALFNGAEGLYYDLLSSSDSDTIGAPGYIHDVDNVININTKTMSRSVSGVYSFDLGNMYYTLPTLSGVYTGTVLTHGTDYTLSGLHTIIFTDKQALQDIIYDGSPEVTTIHSIYNLDLINFSSLNNRNSCITELNTAGYYDKIDFTILDNTTIRVTNLNALQFLTGYESEKFVYSGLRVSDSLSKLMLANFDPYNTSAVTDIIGGRLYEPYLEYYETATGLVKDGIYASTLSRWVYALQNSVLLGPSMAGIPKSLNILYNAPFSYFDGIVTSVTNDMTHVIVEIESSVQLSLSNWFKIEPYLETLGPDQIIFFEDSIPATITTKTFDYQNNLITISGVIIYKAPLDCTIIKSQGDTVSKFEVLCDGVGVNDYISGPTTISGLTNWATNPEEYYNTLQVVVPQELLDFNYYDRFIQYYINDVLPPNLIIKGDFARTFPDKSINSIKTTEVVD